MKLINFDCKKESQNLLGFWVLAFLFMLGNASAQENMKVGGLHIIFDGSGSMCGYLSPHDGARTFFSLVKHSAALQGPGSGNRILLLKQVSKNKNDVEKDLVDAPNDFLAQTEILSTLGEKVGKKCHPFNGATSKMDMIFDDKAPSKDADTMILITDGQLNDNERKDFLGKFSTWIGAGGNATQFAGFAISQVPYSGKYYPIAAPSGSMPVNGYDLGKHERPLLMFWFAKSKKYLPDIKEMVAILTGKDSGEAAMVQHVLPVIAKGSNWFDTMPPPPDFLHGLLEGIAPKIDIILNDKARSIAFLQNCLSGSIRADKLVFQAAATCRDGKPIFEGVHSMRVHYNVRKSTFFEVTPPSINGITSPGKIIFPLSPKLIEKPITFKFGLGLKSDPTNLLNLESLSVNSDFCPPEVLKLPSSFEKSCTNRLNGRTFQLDVFSKQMIRLAELNVLKRIQILSEKNYSFEFSIKR